MTCWTRIVFGDENDNLSRHLVNLMRLNKQIERHSDEWYYASEERIIKENPGFGIDYGWELDPDNPEDTELYDVASELIVLPEERTICGQEVTPQLIEELKKEYPNFKYFRVH